MAWTVNCGPHEITVTAPDEAAARSMGVWSIQQIEPHWWKLGPVRVRQVSREQPGWIAESVPEVQHEST